MIKFFRNIRQQLLSEGKTDRPSWTVGRYFKYAIGEIILVVIGILIALQINNWNEEKKARVYEKKMLIEIKHALVKDVEFFKNHLMGNRLTRIQNACRFFEDYLITDSINKDSINYHYDGLTNGLQVTYNKGPYEALKSTGIDRVINDSLRNMIIELYEFKLPRQTGLISIYMDRYMTSTEKYDEELRDDLQLEIQNGKVIYHYMRMKEVDLKTDQSFLTLLSWGSSSSKAVIYLFNSIIPDMENLITELNQEIDQT
ncbi:DUF6090 family protein [Namhaeicola litoreus]|uniref:DUF6090 family protein n=1 Tax=Namhaeicola litoreus TaxID=1052145 RepID=A0ABW3Y2Y9_9FLAO